MKRVLFTIVLITFCTVYCQSKPITNSVHVFVALCDNANQGIVPVPEKLGNGQDPTNNLYWGAMYGLKSYFNHSKDWVFISSTKNPEPRILERVLFKHSTANAYLLAYIGHDGLMEFDVKGEFEPINKKQRDAIILACVSKDYFKPYLEETKANPLVWSTGLMSPEAYTLKWALDGWVLGETDSEIRERAAKAYHNYQKCGINGARRLLVTGW
ncbi:hypothetical protein [Hyunsoonleella rubra]|uniref:Uncharacterized protein n=1 Tax=Hyunsoonleella rubra TaxID=1737062 RepID=A0ABW5T7D7_9FLAO